MNQNLLKSIVAAFLFFFIVATAVNAATYITIDGIRYVYNSTKTYVSVASVKSPSVYVGDVVIPEIITNTSGKVISVKAVKSSVFGDCTDVTSVTLPSSVTLIGDYAFEGNPQITEVYSCCANPPEIKKGYLDGEEIYTIFDDTDYFDPAGVVNVSADKATISVVSSGKGEITITANTKCDVKVVSINGSLVKDVTVQESVTVLSGLSKGIYVVNGKKVIVK